MFLGAHFEASGVVYSGNSSTTRKGDFVMNKELAKIALLSSKINRQHVQILFVVLTLCMLVLGIGAPSDGGGSIRAR
jgi:hypothetical protein